MTLILNFTPEFEFRLREAAKATGDDLETFVLRAVEDRIAHRPSETETIKSDDEWRAKFNAWLASRKPVRHFVDDSRESIYADRGL